MTSRAALHRRAGHWPNHERVGLLTLDFDSRHRRRLRLTSDAGEQILLDLPKAVAMADGDGIRLDDGRWLAIKSAAEPIVEVSHHDASELARIAWHLGNRHLPIEIKAQKIRIRPDHVIEEMLVVLGAHLAKTEAAFQPEGGAYREDHSFHHDHDHGSEPLDG